MTSLSVSHAYLQAMSRGSELLLSHIKGCCSQPCHSVACMLALSRFISWRSQLQPWLDCRRLLLSAGQDRDKSTSIAPHKDMSAQRSSALRSARGTLAKCNGLRF